MSSVLISAIWFPCCTAWWYARGFRAIGWEVVTCGPSTGRFIPWNGGMVLDEKYQTVPDVETSFSRRYEYQEVRGRMGGDPDLVVEFDAWWGMEGVPAPHVCLAADNQILGYHTERFDLVFGAHSWGHGHTEKNFRWLPGAHDPDLCFDKSLDRSVDVGLVGSMYQHRWDAVRFLYAKGLTVEVGCGLLREEYNDFYNRCKMALVLSGNNDLSGRVFEHMAQGCLVLSDRNVPDMAKVGMKEGEHFLAYGDMWELAERARQGRDGHYRAKLTEAAKEWVRPHTWANRAEAIVRETEAFLGDHKTEGGGEAT